jgi:hypothetical protein
MRLARVVHGRVGVIEEVGSHRLQDIERRWLGPNQYRGVFALRSPSGAGDLQAALERLAGSRALAAVPGLRTARWVREPSRLVFEFTLMAS